MGLGRTTFYGLIANGAIRTVKVGGRRLIPVDAIDEFLRRQASTSIEGKEENEQGRK